MLLPALGVAAALGYLSKKGKKSYNVPASGAYPGYQDIGTAYQKILLDQLSQPYEQSREYAEIAHAIRDRMARTESEQLGQLQESAVQGGWYDSGARFGLTKDIMRGRQTAESMSLRDAIIAGYQSRLASAFPYLSAASNEYMTRMGYKVQGAAQDTQMWTGLLGTLLQAGASAYAKA